MNNTQANNNELMNTPEINTDSREKSTKKPYKKLTQELLDIFINAYTNSGQSIRQVSKTIGMSEGTMRRWVMRIEDSPGGMPVLKKRGRTAPSKVQEQHLTYLEQAIEEKSETTLLELSHRLQQEFPGDFPEALSVSAMHKTIVQKLSFTLKKAEIYCMRRNDEEVKRMRFEYVTKIVSEGAIIYNRNCIFVDEAGFNLHINRTQAWSKKNSPARITVPASTKAKNVTIFGAISHRGVESLTRHNFTESNNANNFQDFIEDLIRLIQRRNLAETQYIIFDNAPIHNTQSEQLIRDAGFVPVRLPPWSPFLNPMEEFFSKLKNGVKKHKLLNHDELLSRISASCDAITEEDCQGWIRHSLDFFPSV